jgi:methyl-accepting chemotaxis protein
MFLARSISKPLMLCRDALNKVSAGDLTALVNLNRKDEFGDMASALDNTVTSLKMALGEDKVNWDDVASYFRELRSSMKQITAIITQSPLPMMLATQSGVVSYANPAAENSLRQLSAGTPASGTLKDQKISESIFSSLDEHLSRPSSLPLSTQLVIAEEHLETKLELIETVDDEDDVILMTWKVITQDLENAEALRQSEERDKAAVENLKNLLKDLRNVFELAGKGDLTHTLAQSPDQSLNEIVNTVNEFMEHLSADLSGVLTHAQELSNSAFLVSGQSEKVESGAVDSNEHCKDVATNSSEVAELLTGAAAAIQEISSTISFVSDGTNNAEKVANDAVEYTRRSAETVQSLYDSSTNIGSVLKMISAIAEQTNLLALNATIEAARAGEAGKGFAVVANEVKELAKQTADATDEIGSRVKNIQADSNNAVDAISNIDRIVNEINDYQSTIAVSLEQQSAAVKEMSEVVHRSVNKSESINVRMDEVLNITEDAKTISGDSLLASSALVGESEALNRLLSKYQLKNRQASASS